MWHYRSKMGCSKAIFILELLAGNLVRLVGMNILQTRVHMVHEHSSMEHNWYESNLLLFVEMNCYRWWIDDDWCTASTAADSASSAEMAFGEQLTSLAMHLQTKQSKQSVKTALSLPSIKQQYGECQQKSDLCRASKVKGSFLYWAQVGARKLNKYKWTA